MWQHMIHPLADRCRTSLAEALIGASDQGGGAGAGAAGAGAASAGAASAGAASAGAAARGSPFAGRANVYVSYHGGMNFESVLEALEAFEAAQRVGQGKAPGEP